MSETNAEYQDILDEMIRIGKLKAEYKDIILEISELGSKACANGLIFGFGWGEDANHVVLRKYEFDRDYTARVHWDCQNSECGLRSSTHCV